MVSPQRCRACVAFVAVVLLLQTGAIDAGDWPQWRGPNRDNVSTETGLLTEWAEGGPPRRWTVNGIGDGVPGISIADGRIFTMGYIGDSEFAFALRESTGELIWRTRLGPSVREIRGMRWLSQRTATIDDERGYFFTARGELICLRVKDGEELWRRDYIKEFGGKRGYFGYCDFPLVDCDRLICTPGGMDAALVALDRLTGKVVWKCALPETDGSAHAAVIAAEIDGVRQYVNVLHQSIVGVAADDGRLLWRTTGFWSGPGNTYPPMIQGNRVFCASSGNSSRLLELKRSGERFRITQETAVRERFQPWLGSTVLVDGHVYTFSPGVLSCRPFGKTEPAWRERIPLRYRSPMTYADGHLYLRGQDGTTLLVEVSPKGWKLKSQFKPDRTRKEPAWSFPVIANGRLYLRDQEQVQCYDIRSDAPAERREPVTVVLDRPPSGDRFSPTGGKPATEPDAIFVPTPQDIVEHMLKLADVKQADVVYDLGSGDGRIVITAAKKHGVRAVGYEIDEALLDKSRAAARKAGVADRVNLRNVDLFTADLTDATVVAVYLPSPLLKRLLPNFRKMRPGTRIVSHEFVIPGHEPDRTVEIRSSDDTLRHRVHLWTLPLKQAAGKPE